MYNEEFKDKIKEDLKKSLSSHRYTHVLGVAAAARELADRYGCDADTAEVAGLLHDAAKQLPLPDMQALAENLFPSCQHRFWPMAVCSTAMPLWPSPRSAMALPTWLS